MKKEKKDFKTVGEYSIYSKGYSEGYLDALDEASKIIDRNRVVRK
jgi:hypothetical protein